MHIQTHTCACKVNKVIKDGKMKKDTESLGNHSRLNETKEPWQLNDPEAAPGPRKGIPEKMMSFGCAFYNKRAIMFDVLILILPVVMRRAA